MAKVGREQDRRILSTLHRIALGGWGVDYLQRRSLHSLNGQPVPVFCHPHSKMPPHIEPEPTVIRFMSIASCPVAWHK